MASLTLKEMREIVDRGETVSVRDKNGQARFCNTREQLPTEAELAGISGDPAKVQAAEEALDAQIKALQDAKAGLKAKPATVVEPPKPEAHAEPAKAPVQPQKPASK